MCISSDSKAIAEWEARRRDKTRQDDVKARVEVSAAASIMHNPRLQEVTPSDSNQSCEALLPATFPSAKSRQTRFNEPRTNGTQLEQKTGGKLNNIPRIFLPKYAILLPVSAQANDWCSWHFKLLQSKEEGSSGFTILLSVFSIFANYSFERNTNELRECQNT